MLLFTPESCHAPADRHRRDGGDRTSSAPSLLIAFNVVNTHNKAVSAVWDWRSMPFSIRC
jgi:hypothetical protein